MTATSPRSWSTPAKLSVQWTGRRGDRIDNPAAYAQTTLTRAFLTGRRRRSSTERPLADLPERPVADDTDRRADRVVPLEALGDLEPADRAVLVLRYLDDLSVAETAERMGVSAGAVRSRSLRALAHLRPLVDESLVVTPKKGSTP